MRDPSGHTLVLSHSSYRAEVVTVGATLRSLTHTDPEGTRDLVAGWPAGEMNPQYRGWIMMPFPNRIADGRWELDGTTHQLTLTEPARGHALHGLTGWVEWEVTHHDEASASLRYELPPQTGYPFALDLTADYVLGDDGLKVTLAATNAGTTAAPYGTGHHPYVTLGRRVDDLVLSMPAGTYCEMDERCLPEAPQPVDGTAYDFREPRPIGDLVLDHPFGGLTDNLVTLTDPDSGRQIRMVLGEGFDWVHLFSSDPHEGEQHRATLGLEPMTCPPESFNTGIDLVVLEPGETHSAWFVLGC